MLFPAEVSIRFEEAKKAKGKQGRAPTTVPKKAMTRVSNDFVKTNLKNLWLRSGCRNPLRKPESRGNPSHNLTKSNPTYHPDRIKASKKSVNRE
jgi:hypothetical protein